MRTLITLIALSCAAQAQTAPAPKTAAKAHPHAAVKKAAPDATPQTFPAEPGLYAAFNTSEGRIVVRLFEKEAPLTVKNFTALSRGLKEFTDPKTSAKVKRPFYNGLTFHRVIPGFMIQGGDPTGTGAGDGGLTPLPDEFDATVKFDQKGRLAMANAGPRTGTCQFFITDSTPEYLNGKHTIFGQVVDGQDIVTKIAGVPRDARDKPNTPVVIKTVIIKRVGAPVAAKPAVHHTAAKAPAAKTP